MAITHEDKVYFGGTNFEDLPEDLAPDVASRIQEALLLAEKWGINPAGVHLDDFDLAWIFIQPSLPTPRPDIMQIPKKVLLRLIMKHKGTGRMQDYDPIVIQRRGAMVTAIELTNLARPE